MTNYKWTYKDTNKAVRYAQAVYMSGKRNDKSRISMTNYKQLFVSL